MCSVRISEPPGTAVVDLFREPVGDEEGYQAPEWEAIIVIDVKHLWAVNTGPTERPLRKVPITEALDQPEDGTRSGGSRPSHEKGLSVRITM